MVDAAFAAEYKRHYSLLLGIARSCSHGRVDPEDILQTCVEKVYVKTLSGEYDVTSFRNITARAIPREAINVLQKQTTAAGTTKRCQREQTTAPSNETERAYEEAESIAGIETAIEQVRMDIESNKRRDARPDVDKLALAILVRERQPFKEASALAHKVGLPRAVVVQRMVRVRRKLQIALRGVPSWRAV